MEKIIKAMLGYLAIVLGAALGIWLWFPASGDLAAADGGQVHRWVALAERLGVKGVHAWEQAQEQEIDAWWDIEFDESRLPGEESLGVNNDQSITRAINCINSFRMKNDLPPFRESYALIRLARNRARMYAGLSVDGVDTILCEGCVEAVGRVSFGKDSCSVVSDNYLLGNYSRIGYGLVNWYVVVILRPEAASQ